MAIFGIGKQKKKKEREKRRLQQNQEMERKRMEMAQQQRVAPQTTLSPEEDEFEKEQQQIDRMRDRETERANKQRDLHRREAMEDIMTDIPGLSPKAREAMQQSANKQIMDQLNHYSRMVASSQGHRGVRGGNAQADLRRKALDAQNQFQRDLMERDSELALQKLAQYLNAVEGRGAGDILLRQQMADALREIRQRDAARRQAGEFQGYFNRVGY